MFQMNQQIQRIFSDSNEKKQKIDKLIEMNQSQTELFNLTKESINQNIDILKQQIKQFYQKTIKINMNYDKKITKIQNQIQFHDKHIQKHSQQLINVSKLTTLYESQRQQIRLNLQKIVQFKQFAITREQYENDRKYHKIQNQMTKQQITKILNQALTPQIRAFLPTLIGNLQLLKKLDKQIKQCQKQILTSRQTQTQLQQKILKFQYSTKKKFQQKQIQLKKLSNELQKQTNSLSQQFRVNATKVQQSIGTIEQTIPKIRQQYTNKFQNFIQQNKVKIYLAVLRCKPSEMTEEEERLKGKINGFQQQMEIIQKQVIQRCDNVASIGAGLENKLELFQNRITKAKSDLKVQSEGIKKIIQSYNKKIQDSQYKNHQQSQIISKILQICMLNTSLQIDDQYLNISKKYGDQNIQSYISFHDGIIYEINNDIKPSQCIYRKKKVNRQVLKRCLLNQQTKLIDYITENMKTWFWNQEKERPSQFFVENVYPAYQHLIVNKKQIIQARNSSLNSYNDSKQLSSKNISPRRSRQNFLPTKTSNKRFEALNMKNLSKASIQLEKSPRNQSIDSGKGTSFGQRISFQQPGSNQQMYQTLDTVRPNRIKLKKIDKKEQEQFKTGKNRYSMNKQTVIG